MARRGPAGPGGPETAFLGLGSNLGDPLDHLQQAVDLLHDDPLTTVLDVSSVYLTTPVGGPEQDDYLNLAVRVATRRSPHGLLRRCQAVEAALHRVRAERWGPRTIDVDLLLYGSRVVRTRRLEVPHPRLTERAFALVPLLEVAPGWSLLGGRREAGRRRGPPRPDRRRHDDRPPDRHPVHAVSEHHDDGWEPRRAAVIGPGRVGGALALALGAAGVEVVAVAGRPAGSSAGTAGLERFRALVPGAAVVDAVGAARAADLVVVSRAGRRAGRGAAAGRAWRTRSCWAAAGSTWPGATAWRRCSRSGWPAGESPPATRR